MQLFSNPEITGYIELQGEIVNPGVAPADKARIYLRDNGSGKSQLVVVFQSGAVQQIALEP